MCGIAGSILPTERAARAAVAAMVDAQRHRGPDDRGEFHAPFGPAATVALGHRRLSILDLSTCGHQPMVHPQTGDAIVFNGEIYNFRALRRELEGAGETFGGTGDTEVLLRGLSLHGAAYLDRLEGMYAFAFLNARDHSLLLARDPMGIKPLYVARPPGGGLLFASEVRAIVASGVVPADVDTAAVAGLLAYGAVQQPRTIFSAVRSFPPASHQTFRPGTDGAAATATDRPTRFWSYPAVRPGVTELEAVESVERTLDEAVRDHLESDVPVGVFLSSGLDSTVVAALAAKHSAHIRSFTVGFADQPDMSELSLARETAKLLELRHTELNVTSDDAETAAMAWLGSMDQPSMDGLNVYVISQAVREQGITVALSGQGGDELFGGYPSFTDVPRLGRMLRRIGWAPAAARVGLGLLATVGKSQSVRRKMADVMRTDGSLRALYLQRRRAMSDSQLRALGVDAADPSLGLGLLPAEAVADLPHVAGDDVATVSRLESTLYQGNMLLRDGDANSMAHGLEVRVPMLDRRMLDLVHALPGNVRLPLPVANKHLLRRAFAPCLRPALLDQPKRGFTLPIRRWMVGPLRELCEHAILHLKAAEVLRPAGVDAVWQSFLAEPESPVWSRALTLCVLGMYLKNAGRAGGETAQAANERQRRPRIAS